MAVTVFVVVLLLESIAACNYDDSVVWWSGSKVQLPCEVPQLELVQPFAPKRLPIDGPEHRRKPFTWTHNGHEVSPKRISTNGTLEVSRRKSSAVEGVYQCSVRIPAGVILALPVTIATPYMANEFSAQPENRTSFRGDFVWFKCEIPSAPPANITWYKDGQQIQQNNRLFIMNTSLLITELKEDDAGTYSCVANNSIAKRSVGSALAWLSVETSVASDGPWAIEPLAHEGSQWVVSLGGKALLPCLVPGHPEAKILWQYTPIEGRTGELEHSGQVLLLPNVHLDQEGEYSCSVIGHSHLNASMNVSIRRSIPLKPSGWSRSALRASTVRFSCQIDQMDQIDQHLLNKQAETLVWYKDGHPLTLTGRKKLLKSALDGKLELVISGVTSEDAGVYSCMSDVGVSWGVLSVSGVGALAPNEVHCVGVSADEVLVTWSHSSRGLVVAYTVHASPLAHPADAYPSAPTDASHLSLSLAPLQPMRVQVKAYGRREGDGRSEASDLSAPVICQGQGVPVTLHKSNDSVVVSWKEFSDSTPGVRQWKIQVKKRDQLDEQANNITLPGDVHNYTIQGPNASDAFVRVLGSLSEEWIPQNLTLLPWTDAKNADEYPLNGEVSVVADEVEVEEVSSNAVQLRWSISGQTDDDEHAYTYIVCVKKKGYTQEICQESEERWARVVGLDMNSEYQVLIQVRAKGFFKGGPFSKPVYFETNAQELGSLGELQYKMVDESSILVWWQGVGSVPGQDHSFVVRFSSQLKLPLENWSSMRVNDTRVVLRGVGVPLFVVVSDGEVLSEVLAVSERERDVLSEKETARGLWTNAGLSLFVPLALQVKFSQVLEAPLNTWTTINLTDHHALISTLDRRKTTFVIVNSLSESETNQQVLTIPPAQEQPYNYHMLYGLSFLGVSIVMILIVIIAYYIFKHKRRRLLLKSRRRTSSGTQTDGDQGSELKTMSEMRRSLNGDLSTTMEPLLNGHISSFDRDHLNMTRTPNGKSRCEAPFDVSRYSTNESEESIASGPITALDTSREHPKATDDNMNLEPIRARHKENKPILQPNG